MRKWELIKQSQLLKIKSQILSNLFNEKYGLRLGEFKNTTGTERVKFSDHDLVWNFSCSQASRTLGQSFMITIERDQFQY